MDTISKRFKSSHDNGNKKQREKFQIQLFINIYYTASHQRNQFNYTFCSGRIPKPPIFTYKLNLAYQVLVFCIICLNVKLAPPVFCISYILINITVEGSDLSQNVWLNRLNHFWTLKPIFSNNVPFYSNWGSIQPIKTRFDVKKNVKTAPNIWD